MFERFFDLIRMKSLVLAVVLSASLMVPLSNVASSFQENPTADADAATISELAQAASAPKPSSSPAAISPGINFLELLLSGGWLMIPIAGMSLLVVTIALERAIGLRRNRVLPRGLVKALGDLAKQDDMLDPRAAYRLCQKYPSAAANVIRTMLLKIGRPHSEIEHTVAEATQREADRLQGNVRWLNLATAVTPLMGLLGTVWGMIEAFHATTQIMPGQDRAEQLAQGIYIALVTTLAGLMVAIPSSIFAHYFEGRITTLFRQIDELLFHLLPQVERYEGRARFDANQGDIVGKSSGDGNLRSAEMARPSVATVGAPPSSKLSSVERASRLTN